MKQPEYWLRGPVTGVPSLLQPVAHALLQANDEINTILNEFPEEKLWKKPYEVASVAFHLQHIVGVIDRLFTYAEGNALSKEQLKYLSEEGLENENISLSYLLNALQQKINATIEKLKSIDSSELTMTRNVGRQQLPSTVMGLIFHAAEHTMRHTGQLLVTTKIIISNNREYGNS